MVAINLSYSATVGLVAPVFFFMKLEPGSSLDGHGHGISPAEAESRDAAMNIATNHFVDQRDQDTHTAGADGMSDGDSAAIHIHFVGIESEFAHHPDRLHGECFVQFVQIHVFVFPASLFPV